MNIGVAADANIRINAILRLQADGFYRAINHRINCTSVREMDIYTAVKMMTLNRAA